jgi:uncharacterized protein (DUF2141 family)
MNIFAIAATAALVAASSAAFAQSAPPAPTEASQGNVTLTVTYTGIATQEGAIMVALFDSEAAFNGGAPLRVAMVPATATDVSTAFEGLAPGRYAIKSFHDVDGDNRMSMNPMGIPIEPFAFSNNARGNMGAPTWADSVFEVSGTATHSISFQ